MFFVYYINGDKMKLLEKYKIDKFLLIPIVLFILISILTIYSSKGNPLGFFNDKI